MSAIPTIKPCPFCGHTDNLEVQSGAMDSDKCQVVCTNCGAAGPEYMTERAAIRNWNACDKRKEAAK